MKKAAIKIVCLMMCLLLVISFSACDKINDFIAPTPTPTEKPYEPKDAQELWQKIDGIMNDLESYESKENANMIIFNTGYKMEATAEGKGIYYLKKGEEFFYNSAYTKMVCKEASIDEAYENLVAYNNGKMFLRNIEGKFERSFCSEMTYEEFLVAQSDQFLNELDVLACTDAKYTKNEDKSWTLDFSGYTKKAINGFLKDMEFTEKELGSDITDMKIHVIANELFYVTKMEIELVFDEDATAKPVIKVTSEYSKHNAVEPDRSIINEGSFAKVDDVRIIKTVKNAVKALKDARSGSFILDVKETVGNTHTYTETDTVTYGEQNGGYYYDINAKLSQGTITIKYKNGTQTIKSGSESESGAMTDEMAKKFIESLVDQVGFNELYISAIEKQGENSFKFLISNPDNNQYDEFFKQNGIKKIGSDQTVIVTLENGEVKKIESKITVNGTINYQDVKIVLQTALTIKSVSQITTEL
ncbi:MAG: hypothetical protein E7365_07335 [Clostridiales bacterium]|nr:hypothetical protein [Clostridiales bacterium]